jgi:hypothetical protein
MATREVDNLVYDLHRLKVGQDLELETFGRGDYKPGKLLITRLPDLLEVKVDPNGKECDENILEWQYTITSFEYGPYQEDEDGQPIEAYPEEIVSPTFNNARELAESIGEFAY